MPMQNKEMCQVQINEEWCKGCGICVAFCPKQVLALDERDKAGAEKPEACTGCALCALRCPEWRMKSLPCAPSWAPP